MDLSEKIDKPILTLGVCSQLSGVPTHSIQQYVNNALIIPFKLETNRHLFSQSDLVRLKNISFLLHEKGLNFAGIRSLMAMIPCWTITECPIEVRQKCGAFHADGLPCWEVSGKDRACRNNNCRECDVYTCLNTTPDLKSVLRKLLED